MKNINVAASKDAVNTKQNTNSRISNVDKELISKKLNLPSNSIIFQSLLSKDITSSQNNRNTNNPKKEVQKPNEIISSKPTKQLVILSNNTPAKLLGKNCSNQPFITKFEFDKNNLKSEFSPIRQNIITPREIGRPTTKERAKSIYKKPEDLMHIYGENTKTFKSSHKDHSKANNNIKNENQFLNYQSVKQLKYNIMTTSESLRNIISNKKI